MAHRYLSGHRESVWSDLASLGLIGQLTDEDHLDAVAVVTEFLPI